MGQRLVKQLQVTSSSSQVLLLSTDLLSPEGTFNLVNAVRPLQAQGTSTLSVAFLPQVCLYSYSLTVRMKFAWDLKM